MKNSKESPAASLTQNSNKKCLLCNGPVVSSFVGRDLLFDKPETYDYVKCTQCGLVFQNPMPSDEQISNFYLEDYAPHKKLGVLKKPSRLKLAVLGYEYGYPNIRLSLMDRIFGKIFSFLKYRDSIHFIENARALDIGCGNGEVIRNMNLLGWQFEGVEFNETAVDICRSAGLKVFHGDIYKASFKEDTFDLITAHHLIEHIPDPERFVSEISRILKPGGKFVIQTPNTKALGRRWFGTNWFADEVPRHLVLFAKENLNLLMKKFGLFPEKIMTVTTPKIILNSWDYLIGNRGRPSKKKRILRILAKLYVITASITRQGDIIFAVYEKS